MACAHEGDTAALSGSGLASALAAAETRAGESGARLTAPRRRVLELLLQADHPVKAYDLMAGYDPAGGAPAKPPTVYRALEFLERQGLVHRIESLNAYVACRGEGTLHGAAFLICDCCGAAREVAPPDADAVGRMAEDAGYTLRALVVEARGLCPACR